MPNLAMTEAAALVHGVVQWSNPAYPEAVSISRGREWRAMFADKPCKGFMAPAGKGLGHRLYNAAGELCGFTCSDLVFTSKAAWLSSESYSKSKMVRRVWNIAGELVLTEDY